MSLGYTPGCLAVSNRGAACDSGVRSGYAKGIIPNIGVQILGIADSYDAMISSRVYHQSESRESAFEELLLCTKEKENGGKGILYNLDLVNQFIKVEMQEMA